MDHRTITKQLQDLDAIENELVESLAAAGMALKEVAKDRTTVNNKLFDQFTTRLERAAAGLSQQITYLTRLSTSQSAESSSYGCRKDYRLPQYRLEYAKTRLSELSDAATSEATTRMREL